MVAALLCLLYLAFGSWIYAAFGRRRLADLGVVLFWLPYLVICALNVMSARHADVR